MAKIPPNRSKLAARDNEVPSLVAQAAKNTASPSDESRYLSARMPLEVLQRMWGTCEQLDDVEDFRSITAFTIRAIDELCERLEAEHNGGKRYHADENPFKGGRPRTYRR